MVSIRFPNENIAKNKISHPLILSKRPPATSLNKNRGDSAPPAVLREEEILREQRVTRGETGCKSVEGVNINELMVRVTGGRHA